VNAPSHAVAMKYPFRTKKNGSMVRLAYAKEERADKGCIGSYMKLCDFTLLFMILQVEL
jgi:hypothetical protein